MPGKMASAAVRRARLFLWIGPPGWRCVPRGHRVRKIVCGRLRRNAWVVWRLNCTSLVRRVRKAGPSVGDARFGRGTDCLRCAWTLG